MVSIDASDAAVGVVLGDCGEVLRKRLDLAALSRRVRALAAVVTVRTCRDISDAGACAKVVMAAARAGARRLVVAGCGRGRVAQVLEQAVRAAGLNEGCCWLVNIAEHGALVHNDRGVALDQAAACIADGVRRVGLATPLCRESRRICTDVLVAGGGLAGLQAAAALLDLGRRVILVHRGAELGGAAGALPELYGHIAADSAAAAETVSRTIGELAERVCAAPSAAVHTSAALVRLDGEPGAFTGTVAAAGGPLQILAGAVVLATGSPARPVVAAGPGLTDVAGLVGMMRAGVVPGRVAFLLDIAGQQGRSVSAQVLSLAELAVTRFGTRVKVFCSSVRVAAAGLEQLYRRARAAGVVVIKFEQAPRVEASGRYQRVLTEDRIAGAAVAEEFDLVVMADLVERPEAGGSAVVVPGLRGGPGGVAQYDDVWLLPSLTNCRGIFAAGGARGNSEYREALTDGLAAAQAVHAFLGDGTIDVRSDAAVVDGEKCVACLTCLRLCPHGAITFDRDENVASVSAISCQRCGACAAECPAGAIELPRYTLAEVNADVGEKPRVIVFACENSAVPAANAAGPARFLADIRIVPVPCAGLVDPRTVLTALEKGAARVLILGCHPESCQYLTGATRAAARVARIAAFLEKAGVDGSRVRFGGLAAVESGKFLEYMTSWA